MQIAMTVALTALIAPASFAWNPEVCSPSALDNRGQLEVQMRKARAGDPMYVPKPFPKTNADVTEDFLQQVGPMVNGPTYPLIETGQRALRHAIEQGSLHIGIVRESNWRNFRCAMHRSGESVYLLRLFDTDAGGEIGRATLEESGLMNGVIYPLDRTAAIWARSLPTLPEGEKILNSVFGKVVDVQYATSYGTVGCDEFLPCVAGRLTGSDGYAFVSYNGIYTFNTSNRRIDERPSVKDKTELDRTISSLAHNEGLTTVGGTYDVIATRVADRP
jgi:hypothetical protein